MNRKLRPCQHDCTYDEDCSACLYKELFSDDFGPEDEDSLIDLRELLAIDDD